jgi:hypothetical protein
MKRCFFSYFFLFFLLTGCQTQPKISTGIQAGFEGLNPAAVVAVPVFVMPDASSESASVDYSLLSTEKLIPLFEDKIIQSFDHQPNINGYPFAVVKKAIGYQGNIFVSTATGASATQKDLWANMNSEMRKVAARFASRSPKTRLLITPDCLGRKNFVQFYSSCLASEKDWLGSLNQLSDAVLNSDTALIAVVTNLQNRFVNDTYQIEGGIAVLLVDTNNGSLIWGNYADQTLINPKEKQFFPSWSELVNHLLGSQFWSGFPGRIEPTVLLSSPAEKGM